MQVPTESLTSVDFRLDALGRALLEHAVVPHRALHDPDGGVAARELLLLLKVLAADDGEPGCAADERGLPSAAAGFAAAVADAELLEQLLLLDHHRVWKRKALDEALLESVEVFELVGAALHAKPAERDR